MTHAVEIAEGQRFSFGANWRGFLDTLDEDRIRTAVESLRTDLGVDDLAGRRFLDMGSGSGLFSLAARRLGARVHSFDYDPASVWCTGELRRRYFPDDPDWMVEEGSALDGDYVRSLGTFDIVYSWGVLHHTGAMWDALANAALPVAPGGSLFIAIYNDCGRESEKWTRIKRRFNRLPSWLRPAYAVAMMAPYEAKEVAKAVLRLRPMDYVRSWTRYRGKRGMSRWHDIMDWVGGYPYEVASVAELTEFFAARGFHPRLLKENAGLGCHELVLEREAA